MKIHLSDICSQCCPDNIEPGQLPEDMARRLKADVLSQIEGKPKHTHKIFRTVLIAAVIAALISTAAFAVLRYGLSRKNVSGNLKTEIIIYDENGEILNSTKCFYPDAGMILSTYSDRKEAAMPEFRCFYLPSGPEHYEADEEGWATYADKGSEYRISSTTILNGEYQFVVCGKPEIEDERYWDDWYVLSISTDYSDSKLFPGKDGRANMVILYNEEKSWLINVCGTISMEELEKIAANMEIRESRFIVSNEIPGKYPNLLNPGQG